MQAPSAVQGGEHLPCRPEAVCAVLVAPAIPADDGGTCEVGCPHARHHFSASGWLHVGIGIEVPKLQQMALLPRGDVTFLAFLLHGTRRRLGGHIWLGRCFGCGA